MTFPSPPRIINGMNRIAHALTTTTTTTTATATATQWRAARVRNS
ncbi:hypothetical protein [Serratia ureilytica]|nr:hypothetical protein [Serratia ureilytica]